MKVLAEGGTVSCPFCGEDDFDLPGLKVHLRRGYCDAYEKVEDIRLFYVRVHGDNRSMSVTTIPAPSLGVAHGMAAALLRGLDGTR